MAFDLINGILNGMKLAIDTAGRIVVPKVLRDRLALRGGTELEVSTTGDALILRPARREPGLIAVDGILVHQGAVEGDLTRAVEKARQTRARQLSSL